MALIITLLALFLLSIPQAVLGSPCIALDANFNLLAFGFNGKDYNAATQDKWTGSNKASDITSRGRPPFDHTNTTCYLSQFQNAIYVMGADKANPSSVYIYNAATSSWSQQAITLGAYDPTASHVVLDHDTNVFYAVSHGEMFFLNMESLKVAQSNPIPWTDVGPTPYGENYDPVMALADNHIYFIDVPNVSAGNMDIFVIHFSFFQPQPQSYPVAGGTIPATHGQATSLFQPNLVQQEIAFVPEDMSATYVINVITNSTQKLAGPATKDPKATYFAGITALVQLASNGAVAYLPYTQGNNGANAAASWTTVSALAAVAPPSSSTATTASSSASGSKSTSSSGGSSNKASSIRNISRGVSAIFVLAAVVCVL